jgi:predicted GH43/DUF377 family glycosyl hydrolase
MNDRPSRHAPRTSLAVERLPFRFESDDRRVITRPFFPGGETRARALVERVRRLADDEVQDFLSQILRNFQDRHRDLQSVLQEHCEAAEQHVGPLDGFTEAHRLLLGAYFTMEYAIQSAALFNPSIVPHLDQTGLADGAVRFIMSLRATGEGHISSVVFRTGVIEADHTIHFAPVSPYSWRARLSPDREYEKRLFHRKLQDMGLYGTAVDVVMNSLPDFFSFNQLEHAITDSQQAHPQMFQTEETVNGIVWLARSNYTLQLPEDADPSEIVIFPESDNESMGMEDLRVVRFVEDDEKDDDKEDVTYFGTYTAYNGYRVLPQLMETKDFQRVAVHTLNGARAQNKGMALFPKKIGGHYVMCSRVDGVNLYIMYSDFVHFWESAELLQGPQYPWEFVQIGNCGSPLETSEGWLLLTHGVGPMRQYCIGAMLLDLEDPLKVIGSLSEPLIIPTGQEREGYVPNVVYSCGAMIHSGHLYIPYGMSDVATGMACVPVDALLDRLVA